jgi:tetratricopeptide (TPR) repeat protein
LRHRLSFFTSDTQVMRRRLNTRLLLWTVVGTVVLAVSVAVAHDFQFRRNVDVLLRRAQQALKENELDVAATYLEQYLAYQPQDTAALVQYAKTLHQLADSPGAEYRAFLVMEQAVRRAPQDLALRREAAELALAVGSFAEAAAHYQALLDETPQDAQLWQNLGWCQEGQGQLKKAEASYRKSIVLDPKLLLSYARLGNLLLRLERSPEVIPVLDQMVQANPTSFAALMARADYLQATGAAQQSWPDIELAYQVAPKQLTVILAKASVEETKGKFDQARAILKQGLSHHPANLALYQVLVRVELKDGQPAQAIHWLELALAQRPADLALRYQVFDLALGLEDRPLAKKTLAELKNAEGEQGYLWRYGEAALLITFASPKDTAQLQLAQQRLNEVKALQPKWAQPLLLEGLLEEVVGHKAQAIHLYKSAIKLGAVSPLFLYRLADLLYQQHDYAAAAAALARIEEQTKLIGVQAHLGADIALKLGDFPRAAALARQAVPADARDYRDHLWQAKVLALAGDAAGAEAVLRQAVKQSPTIPEVWVALVQRLAQTGKSDQVGPVLAQIPQHVPEAKVALTLARCQEALGDLNQAAKLFGENVELQPDAFMGWKQLAEFHLRHQQYAQAEPWLRQLLDPNNAVPPELVKAARRQLAVALARQNDPAKYEEALALLKTDGKTLPASAEDAVALTQVLASKAPQRPQAIQFLEQLRKQHTLPPAGAFVLAELYQQTGQPAKAGALLHELVIEARDNPEYLVDYIRCLIAQKDVGGAQFYLDRLQQWQPAHPQLEPLQLQLKQTQPAGVD